jgi:hypothetical protein
MRAMQKRRENERKESQIKYLAKEVPDSKTFSRFCFHWASLEAVCTPLGLLSFRATLFRLKQKKLFTFSYCN